MSNTIKWIRRASIALIAALAIPIIAWASNPTGSIPQIGGHIHVTHPDGQGFWVYATSTSETGLGTALLTAYDAAGNGDHIHVSSSTSAYDIGNHNLDLSKGGTVSISMDGDGWYNTVIKSSWIFSTSVPYKDPIIACANNSEVSDLSVIGTASVGSFQAAWGAIGHGCSQTTLRRVFGQADTDIVYLNGITANSCFASTTIDSIITKSQWDSGVIATNCASPNITIENSSINSYANPSINGGTVARGFVMNSNFGTQTVHFINNIFNVGGGSSVNQGISNSVNSSTYVDSGTFNVTGANAIDISNTSASGANVYVNSSVSYNVSKISGIIQASQAGSLSGYVVATTTNANSTLAGGLNVQNGGFVVQQSTANVGVGTPNPLNPFQLGLLYSKATAPATGLTGSQDIDDNGECYTDNAITYHLTVYPYTNTPYGITIQGPVSNTFTWTETGSGLGYTENESWNASTDSTVSGYIIFNDQLGWSDVGNTTSVGDDGCNYGSTPYQNSSVGPAYKITSLGSTAQMGTVTIGTSSPKSDPLTIYESQANTGNGITLYSKDSGTGNNSLGDIVVRDPNDSNKVRIRFYATNANYGDFDLQGSGTSANSIFAEGSFSNSSSGCGDTRQGGFQGVNDGDASHGGFIFYTRGLNGCNTVLNLIAEARGATLGVGWSNGGYIFSTTTLGVYGNASIGKNLYSTVTGPANGLIVEGAGGFGTSSPRFGLSVSTTTSSTSVSPFGIASSSNQTTFMVDYRGHQMTGGSAPSCGSGCSAVAGDDSTMIVTTGSSVSSATVNFYDGFKNFAGNPITPVCVANEESAGVVAVNASSTPTTVVLEFASALTSKLIAVQCRASLNFTF